MCQVVGEAVLAGEHVGPQVLPVSRGLVDPPQCLGTGQPVLHEEAGVVDSRREQQQWPLLCTAPLGGQLKGT